MSREVRERLMLLGINLSDEEEEELDRLIKAQTGKPCSLGQEELGDFDIIELLVAVKRRLRQRYLEIRILQKSG